MILFEIDVGIMLERTRNGVSEEIKSLIFLHRTFWSILPIPSFATATEDVAGSLGSRPKSTLLEVCGKAVGEYEGASKGRNGAVANTIIVEFVCERCTTLQIVKQSVQTVPPI